MNPVADCGAETAIKKNLAAAVAASKPTDTRFTVTILRGPGLNGVRSGRRRAMVMYESIREPVLKDITAKDFEITG